MWMKDEGERGRDIARLAFLFFLIFWLNLPKSYWGERYFRWVLVVQRHSYCLIFFFLGWGVESKGSWPIFCSLGFIWRVSLPSGRGEKGWMLEVHY